jgi:CheY-like chemotaxis protein
MALSPMQSFESLKGKKVLLADDLDGCRVTGALFLKIAGAEVEVASNGAEALEKALQNEFDAILMDIHMPVLDGLRATAFIRDNGLKAPIVIVSSDSRNGVKERAFELGANSFISKPLTLQRLVQTLNNLFPKSESV